MASISGSLLEQPHLATQQTIAKQFWGSADFNASLDAYWAFYNNQCDHALHDAGRHVQARTHADILEIVVLLKAGRSRDEIRDVLHLKFTKQHENELELLDNAIDLAANVLLMIDFADFQHGFSGRRRVDWKDGSLETSLRALFEKLPILGHEATKLPRLFNAPNIKTIAGVAVVPTNNLLDHLRLTHDDTKLLVFHNASFLKRQTEDSMLPTSLIRETLDTIALLFPSNDPAVCDWYRHTGAALSFDSQIISCGYLKTDDRQIEKFTHWHDQLVVLKQVFDEATPRTLSQWWHDRRNGVQWYTFWVAIVVLSLTLMFGLIQSIEGALQVYGTFRDGKGT